MAAVYAAISDIMLLSRPLTAEETEKAETLLEIASAKLRTAARKYGKDLDGMIAEEPDIGLAAKEITVKAVVRALNSLADSSAPAVQGSQAAMGYSVSMTYLNAGQSLYFLKNELKELGILRQRFGAMEVYGNADDDKRYNG